MSIIIQIHTTLATKLYYFIPAHEVGAGDIIVHLCAYVSFPDC